MNKLIKILATIILTLFIAFGIYNLFQLMTISNIILYILIPVNLLAIILIIIYWFKNHKNKSKEDKNE